MTDLTNEGADLEADIRPGRSAAGFEIGETLQDVAARLRRVTWNPPSGAPVLGWIGYTAPASEEKHTTIAFHSNAWSHGEVVRLAFGKGDRLYAIWLYSGYRGRAFGSVGLGSSARDLREHGEIFYDDGDEGFYFEGATPASAAFYSLAPDEDTPDPEIHAISVHDWDLMREQA